MEQTLIQQSLEQYRKIAGVHDDIEQAVQTRNCEAIAELSATLDELQHEAKENDAAILDLLRNRPEIRRSPPTQELMTLMRSIQERNLRIAAQLKGIMAVQRNDLQKMKKGNTVLQGYRPVADYTGRRISISN
jgi:paraquat-inducible protein B